MLIRSVIRPASEIEETLQTDTNNDTLFNTNPVLSPTAPNTSTQDNVTRKENS